MRKDEKGRNISHTCDYKYINYINSILGRGFGINKIYKKFINFYKNRRFFLKIII